MPCLSRASSPSPESRLTDPGESRHERYVPSGRVVQRRVAPGKAFEREGRQRSQDEAAALRKPAGCRAPSGRDVHARMKELGRGVGPVPPDQRVKHVIDAEPAEFVECVKWLEDRPEEFSLEVYDSLAAVTKPQPDLAPGDAPGFGDMVVHDLLQRRNARDRPARPGEFPIPAQFFLVERLPLEHRRQRTPGEAPVHDAGFNLNRDLEFALDCVEVRRGVQVEIDAGEGTITMLESAVV